MTLYFLFENILTIVTFIVTFSLFYYKPRWRLYTRLQRIDSSHPLQTTTGTIPADKTVSIPFARAHAQQIDDNDDDDAIDCQNQQQRHNDVREAERSIESEEEKGGFQVLYAETNETKDGNQNGSRSNSDYKQIKVLTQNLWVHYLAPAPSKALRLRAFVEFLKHTHRDYDILIIQEIFALRFGFWIRCNELEYLVTELYRLGFVHYTKPSGHLPYFGQNGGIMLFSKYPLIYDDVFRFERSDEIMLRKGFAIGIVKVPLQQRQAYYLCVGTAHCDPYRPNVILSQIEQFSTQIKFQYDMFKKQVSASNQAQGDRVDIVVGGDFNTRNQTLTQGLREFFEHVIAMYNAWTLVSKDRDRWNRDLVTYRSAYLPKYRVWLAICSCGLCRLPSLNQVTGKYVKGYCLDHLLTNIEQSNVQNVSVVDSRYKDVFVSDHLGVELTVRIPLQSRS